eukprot:gnl/MRDRNA2_/MRDRNA2_79658_c0_seq1.p1 gnl/MRDRNA2_/MRDRNA2_79658_c0~~gnl/MRDRNA2_/MRDRNA2_79658_c0_seq1.p1  ORF type:complete len:407 (-),score=51.03 gnl/MRDRNA2_/MRDRNA2_79658_c0_seq1:118-1338(-)
MSLIYSHCANCWERSRLMTTSNFVWKKRLRRDRRGVRHATLRSNLNIYTNMNLCCELSIWMPLVLWLVVRIALALYVIIDFETSHEQNSTDAKDMLQNYNVVAGVEHNPKHMGFATTGLSEQLAGFKEHTGAHRNEETCSSDELTETDPPPHPDLITWKAAKKSVEFMVDRFSLVIQTYSRVVVPLVAELFTCTAWLCIGCLASGMQGYFCHRRQMHDKGHEDERASDGGGASQAHCDEREEGSISMVQSDSELQRTLQQRLQRSLGDDARQFWEDRYDLPNDIWLGWLGYASHDNEWAATAHEYVTYGAGEQAGFLLVRWDKGNFTPQGYERDISDEEIGSFFQQFGNIEDISLIDESGCGDECFLVKFASQDGLQCALDYHKIQPLSFFSGRACRRVLLELEAI